jgi:pimeloyl-ACP methyl ester carboxylesterase
MLGAIASLKDRGAAKVVATAPGGTSQATWQLHEAADLVVIPHRPAKFKGLESFYEEFADVSDDMVVRLLERWVTDHPQQQRGCRTILMKLTGTRGQTLICELDLPPGLVRGSPPCPAVLFAHGFESNARSSRSVAISQRLAKRDIIGVRLDFTGHGRSGGTIQDATDQQMLADLHLAFQSVAGLSEVDSQRLGLVGSGTGGMIALYYAAQLPAVKALVIRGPVCGRETVAARQVKAPTLLIHAESDTALFDSVQTLDRELGAPHQLLRIANSNRLFSDPISMELMVSATVDWLVDHLKLSAASQDRPLPLAQSTAEPQDESTLAQS